MRLCSGRKPSPGMPSRWTSACWRGVISRLTQTKPLREPSLSRSSRALRSGRTAVRSSTASSLSTTLRGSAKTETTCTSVAMTSPLRSTMSGRAAAMALPVARRSAERSSGESAMSARRPAMTPNSARKAKATSATRARLLSTRSWNRLLAKPHARRSRPGRGGGGASSAASRSGWARSVMASPRRRPCGRGGAGLVRALLLRGRGLQQAEHLELAPDLVRPRRLARQLGEAGELLRAQRHEVEMAVDHRLQPVRPVEMLPFGLEHRDAVALGADARLQLRPLLGLVERIVLDRVGVAGRADEAEDRHDMQDADEAHHARALRSIEGSEASASIAASGFCAGASVRSPARSFAERARGFLAHSASLAGTGPLVTATKLGAAASPCGRWREPPPAR